MYIASGGRTRQRRQRSASLLFQSTRRNTASDRQMENIREYTGFDDTNVTVVRIEGEGSINTYVVPMFYLINVLVFI